MPRVNVALERICAELTAEADARAARSRSGTSALPVQAGTIGMADPWYRPDGYAPRREMSEAGFERLMCWFGLDRGAVITIAGKDPLE